MSHPSTLGEGTFVWAINTMCRGGIVQTRPGRKLVASLAGEKLQGMTVFSPRKSIPSMLVAIDGRIYQSAYPFDNFSLIEAIQFS